MMWNKNVSSDEVRAQSHKNYNGAYFYFSNFTNVICVSGVFWK